jgi:hypothetical protein
MARAHARLKLGAMSSDPELRALSPHAKLLYVFFLQDAYLNAAGVMPICDEEWAEDLGLSLAEFEKALDELSASRFVVVGERRREVLVRTFVRNDGIADQPNILKQALAHALLARSPRIRKALAVELRKLPPAPPSKPLGNNRMMVYPDPHACADQLDPDGSPNPPARVPQPPPEEGSRNPSGNPSFEPFLEGMPEPQGMGKGKVQGSSSGSSVSSFSSDTAAPQSDKQPADEPQRDDVDALCNRLCEWLIQNEVKTPTVTKEWRRQARLMLDKDKRELSKALNLIDWCQQDTFWMANIHSIPTFREQYDKLAMRAREEWRRNGERSKANSDALNPNRSPWADVTRYSS